VSTSENERLSTITGRMRRPAAGTESGSGRRAGRAAPRQDARWPGVALEGRRLTGEAAGDFGIVGSVELIEAAAGDVEHALLEDDPAGGSDFDDAIVEMIADEGVAVAEADAAGGQGQGLPSGIVLVTYCYNTMSLASTFTMRLLAGGWRRRCR